MGEGAVTTDVSSFSQTPDGLQCKHARPSFTPWASFRAPEPQLHVGGYPSSILQSSTSQLSVESSELPGDRVHSGCMTSGIRPGPVGSSQVQSSFSVSLLPLKHPLSPTCSCLFCHVFPEHSQAAGRGFRAGQELQCLTVSRAGHQLMPDYGRASLWVRN